MRSATFFAILSAALAPLVSAHGQVRQVEAGGVTNQGPNIYYAAAAENKKTAVRTMYPASSPAFVLPSGFSDASAMACEGASGAPTTLSVKAGSKVTVYWQGATSELLGVAGLTAYNPWVHAMGTVIDYIAPCDGDCSTTNAANLGWTKIAEAGLDRSQSIGGDLRNRMTNKPEKYYPLQSQGAGLWGMAKLVQDGSKWDITVPPTLANGQYIIRHELGALHNPKTSNPTSGPQMYIACVQITVTNGGSATLPAGTKANKLYDPNGDFANYDVYSSKMFDFKNPGPAIWDGVSSGGSGSGGGAASPPSSSSTPVATSTPAAPATTTKAAPTTTSAPAAPATTTTSDAPATSSTVSPATSSTSATSTTLSAPSASATRKCKRRPTATGPAKNGRRAHKRRLSGQHH